MKANTQLYFVVFGATGDLAQKKIIPALSALYKNKKFPEDTKIIAFSRRPWGDEDYRKFITPSLSIQPNSSLEEIQDFLRHVVYSQGTFDDPLAFQNLKAKIPDDATVIYHLAIQPEFYAATISGIASMNIPKEQQKIVIEKPFGHNLTTAIELEKIIEQYFTEDQIYRIDHYLGKQGLQKIIETRLEDHNLEASLNNTNVESIKVRIIESLDIQGRGEFYETVGAFRDVGQNHVLEMLAVATMELSDTKINAVHQQQARAQVLENLKLLSDKPLTDTIIRKQYEGYRQEQDVSPESQTETYFSVMAEIKNERWRGVPIILEAGKAFKEKVSEVVITLKDGKAKHFNIEEGRTRDAYEILLLRVLEGDKRLFVSMKEVEASWRFIDSVIQHFKDIPLTTYPKHS